LRDGFLDVHALICGRDDVIALAPATNII